MNTPQVKKNKKKLIDNQACGFNRIQPSHYSMKILYRKKEKFVIKITNISKNHKKDG